MSQERVLDVIDQAKDFYTQLSTYYDELHDVADQERVKYLLSYLSDFQQRHAKALMEYEETAPHDITDTWFKCGPDKAMVSCFEPSTLTADMNVDDVLREALRLDQCLSDLYREVIDQAQTDSVKEVFTKLLECNQKDMRNLVRDSGHLRDW